VNAYLNREFRVTLQHTVRSATERDEPHVFIAIVSASDLANARLEAESLVTSLNGLVRILDVAEGSPREVRSSSSNNHGSSQVAKLATEARLRRERDDAAGDYLTARLHAKQQKCEFGSSEWRTVDNLGCQAVQANTALERFLVERII